MGERNSATPFVPQLNPFFSGKEKHGERGLLQKGSFQKSPFFRFRDSRELRDSRDFRESPDSGK